MIHARRSSAALASGVVAGTFGTAVDVELNADARRVIGVQLVGVDATYTTVEGSSGILRINSSDFGLSNQDFSVGPVLGSGPGTNSSGQASQVETVPLDLEAGGNETISLSIAPAGPSTVAKVYEAAVIYADEGGAPQDWRNKFPGVVPFGGGQVVRGTQSAVASTNIGNVQIPSWAKEIVAMKAVIVKSGALTTLEETIANLDLRSTIKGTDPQDWPFATAFGAPLGTPVGTGQYLDRVPYTPIYIPMKGRNETLQPFINLRTALTAAAQVAFAVAYR